MSFDVFKFANFINKQFVKCITYVNFVIFHLYGTHEQFVIPVNLLYPRMSYPTFCYIRGFFFITVQLVILRVFKIKA